MERVLGAKERRELFKQSPHHFSGTVDDECDDFPECLKEVKVKLLLEAILTDAVDVRWDIENIPHAVTVQGFLLLRDKRICLSKLNHDVTRATINGLTVGKTVTINLVTVCETKQAWSKTDANEDSSNFYVLSKPLNVPFTGLLESPREVRVENISFDSASVSWAKSSESLPEHYAVAESYCVLWWDILDPDRSIRSKDTTGCTLKLAALSPGEEYSIVVEARKRLMFNKGSKDEYPYFVMAASDPIAITTNQKLESPQGFQLISATCNEVQLEWKSPKQTTGFIGYNLYTTQMTEKSEVTTVSCLELDTDATSACITCLQPSSHYTCHLAILYENTNVTEWDSFSLHNSSLTYSTVDVKTRNLPHPENFKCTRINQTCAVMKWTLSDYGASLVHKFILHKKELTSEDLLLKENVGKPNFRIFQPLEVETKARSISVPCLLPGRTYLFFLQVLYVKRDSGNEMGSGTESRLLGVVSDPLEVRIPAPVKPPDLLISGFSSCHVDLKWWKPSLVTVLKKKDDAADTEISQLIHHYLLAYHVILDDQIYTTLQPQDTSHSLTNCLPGENQVLLIAPVTTTDHNFVRLVKQKTAKNFKRISSILKRSRNYDISPSKPLCLKLPEPISGNINYLFGHFLPYEEELDRGSSSLGMIHVEWHLSDGSNPEEQGIIGFDVSWMWNADGKEQVISVAEDIFSYDIPVKFQSCIVDISVQAVKEEDMWEDLSAPSLQVELPGPPDPPAVCVTDLRSNEAIIEWGEPRLFGNDQISGYQIFLNGKPAGNVIQPDVLKASVPCRPDVESDLCMVALTTEGYQSQPSETIHIKPPHSGDFSSKQKTPSLLQLIQPHEKKRDKKGVSFTDGKENLLRCINVKMLNLTEHSVTIGWNVLNDEKPNEITKFRISWSSVAKPKELEAFMKPSASQFTIRNCASGTSLFVVIYGLNKNHSAVCRSHQLTAQTNANVAKPVLDISSCTYEGCQVLWQRPQEYGDAKISGYLLLINGEKEASLSPHETSYVFKSGRMCQTYTFSLKALSYIKSMNSIPSDPVTVTWPGVIIPDLLRWPTTKLNSICIRWGVPQTTSGAEIVHLKALCMEDTAVSDSKPNQSKFPASPRNKATPLLSRHCQQVEFKNLCPHTKYEIYLDVYLQGLARPVRSAPFAARVARRPATPTLTCKIIGERRREELEGEACDLITERSRLVQEIMDIDHEVEMSLQIQPDGLTAAKRESLADSLVDVNYKLKKCLEEIEVYTGIVSVELSWSLVDDDGDATVSGYQVMVNDKPQGFALHSQVTDTILKLSAYDGNHYITIVAVTDHPVGNSEPSELVVLDTTPYLPFTYHCLHRVHCKGAKFPSSECCGFHFSFNEENEPINRSLRTSLYQNVPKRSIPPPSVIVYDLFHNTSSLLIPTKLSNKKPTLLLFWTHWCLSSTNAMALYTQYAKQNSGKVTCVAICCQSGTSLENHHAGVASQISQNGWKLGDTIRHVCCCGSRADCKMRSFPEVPELFGVKAVPTLIVIHPEGYLAWRGYSAVIDEVSFTSEVDKSINMVCNQSRKLRLTETPVKENVSKSLSEKQPASRPAYMSLKTQGFYPKRQSGNAPSTDKPLDLITVDRRPYSSVSSRRVPSPRGLDRQFPQRRPKSSTIN